MCLSFAYIDKCSSNVLKANCVVFIFWIEVVFSSQSFQCFSYLTAVLHFVSVGKND